MKNTCSIPAYALELFEQYPKLNFIAFTDNTHEKHCALAETVGTGRVHFFYQQPAGDMEFHVHLLWDVMRPARDWFENILTKLNMGLEEVETPGDFYEKIIRFTEKPDPTTLEQIFVELDQFPDPE